jgi:hypothetical protein
MADPSALGQEDTLLSLQEQLLTAIHGGGGGLDPTTSPPDPSALPGSSMDLSDGAVPPDVGGGGGPQDLMSLIMGLGGGAGMPGAGPGGPPLPGAGPGPLPPVPPPPGAGASPLAPGTPMGPGLNVSPNPLPPNPDELRRLLGS